MEGNLCFKTDWAIVLGRKFTIFALFYFVFEGKFQVQAPRGAFIQRGDLMEGFFHCDFGELIFGRAFIWKFTVLLVPCYGKISIQNYTASLC